MNSICKIATSKEHWCSPFFYREEVQDITSIYKLTTREKVIAIAVAIIAVPLIIGAPIVFYLTTAYFKNRAFTGLNVKAICPTNGQKVLINKGVGEFKLPKNLVFTCPCCNQRGKKLPTTIVLKDCIYSYQGGKNADDGSGDLIIRPLNTQKAFGQVDFEDMRFWIWCDMTVKPL
jgi:hypothetical protein